MIEMTTAYLVEQINNKIKEIIDEEIEKTKSVVEKRLRDEIGTVTADIIAYYDPTMGHGINISVRLEKSDEETN